MVTRRTGTREFAVGQSMAGTTVGTWARQTCVLLLTMLTCPSAGTHALVLVVREKRALPPIGARVVGVAGGVFLDLAALPRKTQRTIAAWAPGYTSHAHGAPSTI